MTQDDYDKAGRGDAHKRALRLLTQAKNLAKRGEYGEAHNSLVLAANLDSQLKYEKHLEELFREIDEGVWWEISWEVCRAGRRWRSCSLEVSKFEYYASLHEDMSDYQRAAEFLTYALKCHEQEEYFYCRRARVYALLGNYRKAVADYTKAIKRNAHAAAYYAERAEAFLCFKNYDKAMQDFSRALCLEPSRADFYLARGDACIKKAENGQPDAAPLFPGFIYEFAMADFSRALRLEPENAQAYAALGEAREKLKNEM